MVYYAATGSQYQVYMKLCLLEGSSRLRAPGTPSELAATDPPEDPSGPHSDRPRSGFRCLTTLYSPCPRFGNSSRCGPLRGVGLTGGGVAVRPPRLCPSPKRGQHRSQPRWQQDTAGLRKQPAFSRRVELPRRHARAQPHTGASVWGWEEVRVSVPA